MSKKTISFLAGVLMFAGCMKVIPPTPAPPRPVVEVGAPFDSTWDAAIDVFSSENIPIRTLDRSSGLIAAEVLAVSGSDADQWASCGGIKHGLDPVREIHATHVEFNVLVRELAVGSSIRVNTRWTSQNPGDPMRPNAVCETTNVWERGLERLIKTSAERSPNG